VLGRYLHDHPLAKAIIDLGGEWPLAPASYFTRPRWANLAAVRGRLTCSGIAPRKWHAPSSRATRRDQHARLQHLRDDDSDVQDQIALDRRVATQGRSALDFSLSYPERALSELQRARDELIGALERAGWQPRLRLFHVESPGTSVHYERDVPHARLAAIRRASTPFHAFHSAPNVVVADSSVFTTGPKKPSAHRDGAGRAPPPNRLLTAMREGEI